MTPSASARRRREQANFYADEHPLARSRRPQAKLPRAFSEAAAGAPELVFAAS